MLTSSRASVHVAYEEERLMNSWIFAIYLYVIGALAGAFAASVVGGNPARIVIAKAFSWPYFFCRFLYRSTREAVTRW